MTRVMIVEDNVPAVRLMAWALMDQSVEVSVARTPDDAFLRLEGADSRPDVIVLNTEADVLRKRAWVSELRRLASGVRIVDLARTATQPGHDTGADAYVASPYRLDALTSTIRTLMLNG